MPDEPVVLKRKLYRAPVERIEDPALAMIFREKLDEIDRQITMLQDRNTNRFLPGSMQLYGPVEDDLHSLAANLLEVIPPRSREASDGGPLGSAEFARRAEEEIDFFRQSLPEIGAKVEIRPDVTGLMVSRGNLLISAESRIPASRVEALIQHEVGTHVLTYHNGKAQPLRHLYTGLAGYDALQEGLAVLSEYLVGGLSRPRLRLLAGRVVAASPHDRRRLLRGDLSRARPQPRFLPAHRVRDHHADLPGWRSHQGCGLLAGPAADSGLSGERRPPESRCSSARSAPSTSPSSASCSGGGFSRRRH